MIPWEAGGRREGKDVKAGSHRILWPPSLTSRSSLLFSVSRKGGRTCVKQGGKETSFDYGRCVCEIVAGRETVWEGCQSEPAEKVRFFSHESLTCSHTTKCLISQEHKWDPHTSTTTTSIGTRDTLIPWLSSVCAARSRHTCSGTCLCMQVALLFCTHVERWEYKRTHPVQRFFVCRHMHLSGQRYYHLIACSLWIYSHVLLCLCSPSLHGSMH